MDVVLVANEVVDDLISNRRVFMCKFDMEKVYDHVR